MKGKWWPIARSYGLYAGILALVLIIIGLYVVPLMALAVNLPLYVIILIIFMVLGSRKVRKIHGFMGFNEMLKPLLQIFLISFSTYYIGFLLFEYFVYTDLYKLHNELSLMRLELFSSLLDEQQYDIMRQAIDSNIGIQPFSISKLFISFAMYFGVIGLPLSITISAILNKGFSNEEKIERTHG